MDTLYTFWQMIANTPWWVFVLFFYLLSIGFGATKPSNVPLNKLFIFPIVIIVLSIVSLYHTLPIITATEYGLWAITFLAGIAFGYLQYKLQGVKAIPGSKEVYIPGSWNL